jgi:ectoine hydroxylase-related dioxygenase (phytanoyl-CoA dioxygenase family)
MVSVTQVRADTPHHDIVGILERDGAVVVTGVFDCAKRDAIEAELRPYVERPQAMHRPQAMYDALQLDEEFLAGNTKRAVGLVTKSPTFREQVVHPIILAACDAILKPNCSKYQLQATAAFVIGPGAKRQVLHREEDGYPFFEVPRPDMVIASMLAISDFTFANGATRLVPGSHRWPKGRVPAADEITAGEMPPGSLLLWMGGTLHGAGPNETNEWRFGTFSSYSLGWLRQEENQYLNVPPEVARSLSPELRRIVGYQIVEPSLGFADTNQDLLA